MNTLLGVLGLCNVTLLLALCWMWTRRLDRHEAAIRSLARGQLSHIEIRHHADPYAAGEAIIAAVREFETGEDL